MERSRLWSPIPCTGFNEQERAVSSRIVTAFSSASFSTSGRNILRLFIFTVNGLSQLDGLSRWAEAEMPQQPLGPSEGSWVFLFLFCFISSLKRTEIQGRNDISSMLEGAVMATCTQPQSRSRCECRTWPPSEAPFAHGTFRVVCLEEAGKNTLLLRPCSSTPNPQERQRIVAL